MPNEQLSGIDQLRTAVKAFAHCKEDFLYQFTAEELIKLWRVSRQCDMDLYPDQWAKRQVTQAIKYRVIPRWTISEEDGVCRPDYSRASFKLAT
jgi:hypothetical protein